MRAPSHDHSRRPAGWRPLRAAIAGAALAALAAAPASASTAYGDLNNFDVFNDTGQDCHGFEIELEDVHSTDITYTYDWNHYGAPTITEDDSDPAHPRVTIRYAARHAGGAFTAYTAVPATPPAATDGHMCTDPMVNFGCEHFGVGYYGTPTAVRYHWLIEDPAAPGSLVRGPAVNVATPSWTYYPPAQNQPAQVQAVVLAPPPPPAPVYEFGDAVWVKSIVTTSHNNQAVELDDLVSDDPDDPVDTNWTNGEPDEVEVEWQILQTEFSNPDGANNELAGAQEELPNGDEVVTRRYEFYKYAGPLDPESNEATCDNYPQIGDPADPSYKPECDPAVTTVLGDYIGAQMAGFNVEAVLGLIDHLQDGGTGEPYTPRTVVVGGNTPYVTAITAGALPAGLSLDAATGILSGTPTVAGDFTFTVLATDADAVQVTKPYTLHVAGGAVDPCAGVVCSAIDQCHEAGTCDPDTGLCSNPTSADATPCDDGNACTTGDACAAGTCTGSDTSATTCDDGNLCTTDSCDAATGCLHTDNTAPCDDGNACTTGDACSAGTCAGTDTSATTCDDGNLCTTDSCDAATGCLHTDNTAPCDDGNACTTGDACSAGTCAGTDTSATVCDDGNLCTTDSCDAATGCLHTDNTAPCDDGNACTTGDACAAGTCAAGTNTCGSADLLLRLQRSHRGRVGHRLPFRLTVRNAGPDAALAASATFTCAGSPFHLAAPTPGCIVDGDTVRCALGTLTRRTSAFAHVEVVPDGAGLLTCTATASSATPDPVPGNQTKTLETRIR